MFKIIFNRHIHLLAVIALLFISLSSSLYKLTITENKKYYELSLKSRIRKVELPGERGEITDAKGRLVAYNEIGYAIKMNASLIKPNEFNDQCIKMYDFLNSRGEKQTEFPIYIEDGIFKYRFDEDIRDWLVKTGFDASWTAREVFENLKSVYYIDKNLSDYEAMRLLNTKSVILPISSLRMEFTEHLAKEDFLKSYNLDLDTPAKKAFEKIRGIRWYRIPKTMSDEDAYKILIYRHIIRNKGYLKYEPITVAENVDKITAILIGERQLEFPGLYTDYTTKRIYPYKDLVSHVVGYTGRIATQSEMDNYVKKEGYNWNDSVGKTGIENILESKLHGKSGFKYIEADVYGEYVGEVDHNIYGLSADTQKSGNNIQITLDVELQRRLRDLMVKIMDDMRNGRKVETKWGTHRFTKLPHVETAAAAIIDVKTGQILAQYSYPSYDPMILMDGVSKEDWDSLSPVNSRNPIAARPLIDLTAMMAVQPGSCYKMATAYAAMQQGLNPRQKIFANGHIMIGQRSFGCWLWNQHRGRHGPIDLPRALRVSCNYYFFCIANGKDYYNDRPLNFNMDNDILMNSSRLFGLDKGTGAEVPEVVMGVPEVEKKTAMVKALLRRELNKLLPDYFHESLIDTNAKKNAVIDVILSWADENPSRGAIIERLMELGSNKDYLITEKLADILKYDYFQIMKWYEGDTMNLSIGQGEHAYTPLQMGRYISIIANGGIPIELTYVKSINNKPYFKNEGLESFDTKNHLAPIKQGIYDAVNSPSSYLSYYFNKLPIKIAGKTGTAEKEGLIPPLDEVEYITKNLKYIAPSLSLEEVEIETTKVLRQRSEAMSQLEKKIEDLKKNNGPAEEINELEHRFSIALNLDRLNKGDAMREAIKTLTNNRVDDRDINKFRSKFDNFAWFVGYAPAEEPEISVVVMIPQGGQGQFAALMARDIVAMYYGFDSEEPNTDE